MKKKDLYETIIASYKDGIASHEGFFDKQIQGIKQSLHVLDTYVKNSSYTVKQRKLIIKNKEYHIEKMPLSGRLKRMSENLEVRTAKIAKDELCVRVTYAFKHPILFNITVPLAAEIYLKEGKYDNRKFFINDVIVPL